ncbi:MAG: ComEC/Rec2 family competence protein [Actinomycetaceae bacterium]|nr:ComEC/Rec2 family competence protein [Actinomycetaceae bacterium]
MSEIVGATFRTPRGPRPLPRLHDRRLIPVAIVVWAVMWWSTDEGGARALTGLFPHAEVLWPVLAVVCIISGAGLCLHSSVVDRAPPRHGNIPGGKIRASLGVLAVACGAALWVGDTAIATHLADPLPRAIGEGTTSISARVVLLDDPRPQESRWGRSYSAWAEVSAVQIGNRPWERSAVRVTIRSPDLDAYARADILQVRGKIDPSFFSHPPAVGLLRANSLTLVERPGGWQGLVRDIRASLVRICASLNPQGRGLVPGMAIGDDRALSSDLKDDMRTTSLAHLTAVSGSHIAILLGCLVYCVRSFWGRVAATTVLLIVIVLLVGPQASVIRSVATSSIGLIGHILGRPHHSHSALAAVVIATVLLDPWAAHHLGFALSVVATWAVIGPATSLQIYARHHDWGRCARLCLTWVSIPLCCQIAVTPLLLLIDEEVPTWSLIANLLAAPAVAPATLFAVAAALAALPFPELAAILASSASFFTGWVALIAEGIADWPWARIPIPGGALAASIVLIGIATTIGWWRWKSGAQEVV